MNYLETTVPSIIFTKLNQKINLCPKFDPIICLEEMSQVANELTGIF